MNNEQKSSKDKLLLGTSMEWRVNTPALLMEIIDGYPGQGGIFFQPINIFKGILAQVGDRASELNDPVLNALMCRLAIYAESDPYSGEYDHKKLTECLNHPDYIKYRKNKKTLTHHDSNRNQKG